jgi:hypothetical protein
VLLIRKNFLITERFSYVQNYPDKKTNKNSLIQTVPTTITNTKIFSNYLEHLFITDNSCSLPMAEKIICRKHPNKIKIKSSLLHTLTLSSIITPEITRTIYSLKDYLHNFYEK